MNDFTKEEPHGLFTLIHYAKTKMPLSPKIGLALYEKIQSMIDNYCEHDWRKGVHLFNDVYCTKCQKHFEVNNDE